MLTLVCHPRAFLCRQVQHPGTYSGEVPDASGVRLVHPGYVSRLALVQGSILSKLLLQGNREAAREVRGVRPLGGVHASREGQDCRESGN